MKRYELISKDRLFLKDNKKNEIKEVCFGGLDIINLLNEQDTKWQKLKEWLKKEQGYTSIYEEQRRVALEEILEQMQELEGEDE